MKIAVIGANGKAGSCIVREALERGHDVHAIVRDAAKISEKRVGVIEKSILELTAQDLNSYNCVINAFGAPIGQEHLHVEAGNILIQALRSAAQTRLIVVGGAGSLFADESKKKRILETPNFPKEYYATAKAQLDNLLMLEATSGIQWTFMSPSAHFEIGIRTGDYRIGKDQLLFNNTNESYVSYEDFAVAVIDEIEEPRHHNERFTVVSERPEYRGHH